MSTKVKEKINLDDKTAAVFKKKGYDVTDKIAEGAFGQVYKATKTDTGVKAAVKVMHIEKIPKIFADKFVAREIETLTTIHHPNLLEVFDIFKSNNCYYIFLEFAPNGTLFDQCKKGPIKESKTRTWFKQTTKGLHCMHDKYKICHRDIKPENVLLDSHDVAKLSDFGFAKVVAVDEDDNEVALSDTICGTMQYYAPELVKPKGDYNPFAVDVWAMGVMLYMMLNSDYPFKFPRKKDKDGMNLVYQTQMAGKFKHRDGVILSDQVKDFVKKCLEPDVKKRYTTAQMLKDEWLQKKE